MEIFKNSEIEQIILDESTIMSIKWVNNNGIDIEMDVDWCGQESLKNKIDFLNINTKLLFTHVSDIDFNFKHSNNYTTGALEITEFSFNEIDKRYSVYLKFDFQPVGHIKFDCDEIKFVIEDNNK